MMFRSSYPTWTCLRNMSSCIHLTEYGLSYRDRAPQPEQTDLIHEDYDDSLAGDSMSLNLSRKASSLSSIVIPRVIRVIPPVREVCIRRHI